jgi:pyridoxine 4-dehydrogenase
MKAAFEAGCNLWNAAEFYGTPEYNSMTVIKAYFEKYPEDADNVILLIKGGSDVITLKPDGSPEGTRTSIDNILRQLGGTKKVDAFIIGRRDRETPLKVTLDVIKKEYIDTGKIGGVGLSECRAETIHEASKYVNVAAVEVELSMFSTDILNNGVASACVEHSIPIAAYSPIGRGVSHQLRSCGKTLTVITASYREIQGSLRL